MSLRLREGERDEAGVVVTVHFSRLGDDMRTLSVLFLSSSKKTFIMTMSPVERVWHEASLFCPLLAGGGGVRLLICLPLFTLLLLLRVKSAAVDRLEL